MKLIPLLLVAALSLAAVPYLPAIPQTVGGIFANAAGNSRHLPVEDWFKDPKNWELSTLPKVPWIMGTVPMGRLLADPGQVFGFTADNLVVNSSEAGPEILSAVVQFSADKAKVPAPDLLKRLSRTVAAFTGASEVKDKDGSLSFTGKEFTVTLKQWQSGKVTATLKR